MFLASLSFPLFPLHLFPNPFFFFQLSTHNFFLRPDPFIHLAFILVILSLNVIGLSQLKRRICAAVLCPVFTPSFFKVNCSLQWCFSTCDEHCVFSADYLPRNMIKVTEHLCAFTPAAYMAVLVCRLPVFWFLGSMCLHMFLLSGTIPYQCMCVVILLFLNCHTLCLTCIWHLFWSSNTKEISVKTVAGTLHNWPLQWRKKPTAEPSNYRKYVNMRNVALKTTLTVLTLWLCVRMCNTCVGRNICCNNTSM